jgi:peroxiredoxin
VNRTRFGPADPGTPAPAYRAATLDGDTVSLADLSGNVVLINVWATWCKPCVREMPALQRLYDRFHDRGLEVLAVSIDEDLPLLPGGTGDVAGFVRDLGLSFRVLHDPAGNVKRTFNVIAVPVTIVITRDGRIHEKVLGERAWDDPGHAAKVEALLAS